MVKKALLIGINYIGSEYELNGCINDVKNLKSFLIDNCDFQEKNIKLLSEEDGNILPTSKNIKDNINWLVSNNLAGDTLIFHYSGHGSNIKDKGTDESDRTDETIVPFDFQTAGDIVDDWLFTNMVCKVPANVNLYCFFDSCHSGTVIDLKYNYASNCKPKVAKNNLTSYNFNQWTDSFIFTIERSKEVVGNIFMLSGCKDKETSLDVTMDNKGQGAFTYCLLETLKNNLTTISDGKKRYQNGKFKFRNILKEINCRLDMNDFDQNSQLSLSKKEYFERTLDL